MSYVEAVLVAVAMTAVSRYYLHMMQLESYQLDGYGRWMEKNRDKLTGGTLILGVALTTASILLKLFLGAWLGDAGRLTASILVLLASIYLAFQVDAALHKSPEKKPLAFTARMKRLTAMSFLMALAAALLLSDLGMPPYILFVGIPYLTLAAAWVMQPIEKQISAFYLSQARDKLDSRQDLIKIGITGSYGKTSTKFILAAILSEKYDVLATPGSFNTPMGLTRVVREQLEPHHQVFIAEMGARHPGDIRELVELVHPKYGVLTSVGPQHLETFGDVATVANTKFELIEGLPADGVAFFASDGGEVDKLYDRATMEKHRAGLSGGYLSMRAEDIEVGPFGSRFVLIDSLGNRSRCETKLLGRHNIANIALCAALARRLGMEMDEIARGVSRAEPVEHRLQLIPGANGITIIDDAFNSNPEGAQAALMVLSAFPGRHLIVTPGMVELGEREEEFNYRFGVQIASCCNIGILVGPRRVGPIERGALESGIARENLHVVTNLSEATALLGRLTQPGDVVLFENDLPDNYS